MLDTHHMQLRHTLQSNRLLTKRVRDFPSETLSSGDAHCATVLLTKQLVAFTTNRVVRGVRLVCAVSPGGTGDEDCCFSQLEKIV